MRDGRRRKKVRDALGPGGRRRSVNRRREHRAGLRLARAHDVYSCKGKNSIRDKNASIAIALYCSDLGVS